MPSSAPLPERLTTLTEAFARDGFTVVAVRERDGCLGMLANHDSAHSAVTGAPKRALYVEGGGFTSGWLVGALCPADVAAMCGPFADNVVFDFMGMGTEAAAGDDREGLRSLLVDIIARAARSMIPDIPSDMLREMDGLREGCHAADAGSPVTRERLLALNLGVDCLLAHIYSGKLFARAGIPPGALRTPVGCNAYSLSGSAGGGRHFFGRDFMFPTAGVYQDTALLLIHAPAPDAGETEQLFVAQTAPGLVGIVTGMNASGLAMGINMMASTLCNPTRPGLNSLLLCRSCIQNDASASAATQRIAEAPRGVSWLYPLADASGGACVVEAGRRLARGERFPLFRGVPGWYRRFLPGRHTLRRILGFPVPQRGLTARTANDPVPELTLMPWNTPLWRAYNTALSWRIRDLALALLGLFLDLVRGRMGGMARKWKEAVHSMTAKADFSSTQWTERGYINATRAEANCPGPFYFAPRRMTRPDVLIATNHALSPEMRITAMNEWIALLAGGNQNDMQWRYDELNLRILRALDASPTGISESAAWELITFLRPDGDFPEYYNPGRIPGLRVPVHGSVALCELTERKMTALFGYYEDEPVTVHLPQYLITCASSPQCP